GLGDQVVEALAASVVAAAEELGELSDDGRAAVADARALEARPAARQDGLRDLRRLFVRRRSGDAARSLPAQADGRERLLGGGARRELELVERRDLVPRADLARVDLVVAEVLVGDRAVLVAEEPVALDLRRIELDL